MEEMTNEQSVQADSQPTEATGENATQPVESTESADQASPQTGESDTHDTQEKEEGNDSVDPDNLPADMSEKEKSAIRKMHEATQEASRYKKEADAFQQLLHHPEFNEFLDWRKQKGQQPASPPQEVPEVRLSEEEFLAAQSDPAKFESVLNSRLQSMLNPIAQQAIQKINNLERELAVSKQEREIDAFASSHPDFWDKNPELMKAAIAKTQNIEQAYDLVSQWEKSEHDKALKTHQKKIQEKKQATSASPSRSMEPKIVYADNDTEANRLAFEYARQGKRVDVRIGKSKK